MFNPVYHYLQGKTRYQDISYVGDGSDACFSVRKSNSSYAGSCMKVRRSSDNTTLDIGFVGNDLDTTTLLSFVGAGNGFVQTWFDQSGNNRDLVQTTIANQPSIVTSGVLNTRGTKPVIKFDGVNDIMTINSSTSLFINIHYSIGFISTVIGVTTTGLNTFKGLFGNSTNVSGSRGFYFLYDDRSSMSRNEAGLIVVNNGVGTQFVSVNSSANDIFSSNIACLNIRLDNQNTNILERSAIWGNNNYPILNNTQSNTSSNSNASNNFVIGKEAPTGPTVYDVEVQELILFNSDQQQKAVGFKRNQNSYFNIY